jgi:hypothetical protein
MARSVWNLLYRLGWVLRLTWMRWCVEFDWKKNGYRDVSLSPEVDLEQLDLTSLARGEKVL